MGEIIVVTDLDNIKITKVKPWCIYFTCDDIRYMLINDREEDAHLSLYRRNITDKGYVTTFLLNGKITTLTVGGCIKTVGKQGKALVYRNIDKEYFVKMLTEVGFMTGIYTNCYEATMDEMRALDNQIKELQEKRSNLLKEYRATSGYGDKPHGEKLYKLKAEKAERVKGKKDGEYCEEYNDYYGNIHEEYGGKLVDLFSLPLGTMIWVTNGYYGATIGVNKHGDKILITNMSEVVLTENHHSLYIKEDEEA